jgi:hypothetical protein
MNRTVLFLSVIGGGLMVQGCNVVTDAATGERPQPIVHRDISPGPMNVATSPFVGVFGQRTPNKGMQVKFSSDGNVTVNGVLTTALGTYTTGGNAALATFQHTNTPSFDKATFTIAKDGKSIRFLGPKRTVVHLERQPTAP